MLKIAVQSGHWNTNNGQTGAPRELERTIAIGQMLVDKLNAAGFQAVRCDALADNNPAITDTDWDLFLSLHCDANYAGDEGGGFFDWIDPSIDSTPQSNAESKRIMEEMQEKYFEESGIRRMDNRRNANTKFYYMWDALSSDTHCVLVEMGESIDPHDNVLLNDTNRISNALLHGIQHAFGTQTVPTPTPQPTDEKDKLIAQLKLENHNKDVAITGKDELIRGMKLEYERVAKALTECQLTVQSTSGLQEDLKQLKLKHETLITNIKNLLV